MIMTDLCFSSETYMIEINDVAVLNDSNVDFVCKKNQDIVILMGDMEQNIPDTLLCGRENINKAIANKEEYVAVKIAFISKIKKYDIFTQFIKKLRGKYKIWSSNIYHTNPEFIRKMKIERSFRTKENAYNFTNPLYRRTDDERINRYEKLCESIKNGYDDNFPIDIMLLRMLGIKDNVNNGHHRMAVVLEQGVKRISVRFSAVGQAPRLLHPLLKVIADIAIKIKQNKNS